MKLDLIIDPENARSGTLRDMAYTINVNSGLTFMLLSADLYANKIGAVIREAACNAWDSHQGTPAQATPMSVHLPCALEPWFSVQDSGPGMSPQDIETYYTGYGFSTKQGDNANIGGFGLGCKSPFAYTQSFTVTSCHAGMLHIYGAGLSPDGMPIMSLMHTAPAGQRPTGMMVQLPVKPEHIREFQEQAREILQYMWPRPNINIADWTWPDKPVQFSGDLGQGRSYKIYNQPRYTNSSIRIIMGNVAYQLTRDAFSNRDHDVYAYENWQRILDLEIHVPIGSVSVLPSRESLGYNTNTLDYLAACFLAVSQHASQEITAWLSRPHDSTWQRTLENLKFQSDNNAMLITLVNTADLDRYCPKRVMMPQAKCAAMGLGIDEYLVKTKFLKKVPAYSTSIRQDATGQEALSVSYSNRLLFVLVDSSDRSLNARILDYMRKHKPPGSTAQDSGYERCLVMRSDVTQHAALLQDLGMPPHVLTSQLPMPSRSVSSKTAPGTRCLKYQCSSLLVMDSLPALPCYYIINDKKHYKMALVGNHSWVNYCRELLNQAVHACLVDRDAVVCYVGEKSAAKLRAAGMADFYSCVQQRVTERMHQPDFQKHVTRQQHHLSYYINRFLACLSEHREKVTNPDMLAILTAWHAIEHPDLEKTSKHVLDRMYRLQGLLCYNWQEPTPPPMPDLDLQIQERFPMLGLISGHEFAHIMPDIIAYINAQPTLKLDTTPAIQ